MTVSIKQLLAFGILTLGVAAHPQATSATASSTTPSSSPVSSVTGTGVSPAQSSAFSSALQAYYSSVRSSPEFKSLAINIGIADSHAAAVLEASPSLLLPITATSVDLRSLATAPPLSFSSLSLYSDWNPLLVSSVQAMQTSAVLAIASIDQNILGISASISTPAPSSSTSNGAAGLAMARPTGVAAMGAAVGALGAAVVFL